MSVCATALCCTKAGELGCFHRGRGVVTHSCFYLEQVLRSYCLPLGARAMKVVKSSPPWELGTITPEKICLFLSSVSRKCDAGGVCKYGVHHNPPGFLFHELRISKYLGDSLQAVLCFCWALLKHDLKPIWPFVLSCCTVLACNRLTPSRLKGFFLIQVFGLKYKASRMNVLG